jgi:hypothetical protein
MGKGLSRLVAVLGRMKVLMMRRSEAISIVSVLAIMILVPVNQVNAHAPTSMSLSYDYSDQELSVQVTHTVSDVNTHYIYQVVIEKNSVVVLTRDYTTQNTTSGMSATYSIAAIHGDALSVTAKCIQSGQITQQITVIDPEVTTTPTTPNGGGFYLDLTVMIAVLIVAIGVVWTGFVFLRRR